MSVEHRPRSAICALRIKTMNPNLADGLPLAGDLVAVLDETSPAIGAGIYYVVSSAVVIEPEHLVGDLANFFRDTPGRERPFHWHKEGVAAKQRMIDLIIDHAVMASSRYLSTPRKGQARARQQLLRVIADELHHAQIDHLIIESGDAATNSRDKQTLLNHYQGAGGVPFRYDWRSKNEQLLWIADAINGAIHSKLFHQDESWFKQLHDAGAISEPIYTT